MPNMMTCSSGVMSAASRKPPGAMKGVGYTIAVVTAVKIIAV